MMARLRLALLAFLVPTALVPSLCAQGTIRTFPDTSARIVVFSDQLDTGSMTEAQFQFAAGHYAGSQKLLRDAARHLRTYNPNYLVLHYRLGQALGYTLPDSNCQPTNNYIQIIEGDQWIQEWPGNTTVQESWFFHWKGSGPFYNCDFGHYLMDLDDAGWRSWWSSQVIDQLKDNEDDGVFADSYSIPNYGFTWNPPLPIIDSGFEGSWAKREHAFTDYMRAQFAGRWKWIPNIGAFITTRDPSNYNNVDGVMIEQFAEYGGGSYLALGDWQLQMSRALSLIGLDKIMLMQTYPDGNNVDERLLDLGSYLLVKGRHTYINLLSDGLSVQWLPEYGINLGTAVDRLPASIDQLFKPAWGVYVRRYQRGLVLVNPGTTPQNVNLDTTMYQAMPNGGGIVAPDGSAPGTLIYEPVSHVKVDAHAGVVLLDAEP